MIYSYNPKAVGDVLLVVVKNSGTEEVAVEKTDKVARVFLVETKETVAWNIFDASTILPDLEGNGQVFLSEAQLARVNQELQNTGHQEVLTSDNAPKFVVGFVKSCKKHPDSDHLSITQTEVENGEVLQIVCGAANIKSGLKVVVAKVGAMMPNGLIIWPGQLRGVESDGMICSAKELGIVDAPAKKGILELPFDAVVGTTFTA